MASSVEGRASERYAKPITKIELALWPEVQSRYAAGESLRTLAKRYDASYEAIRGIVQLRYRVETIRCPLLIRA
jgi:Mor family transcriptional regulator